MLVTQVLRALLGLVVYAVTAIASGRLTPGDTALAILADQHLISGYNRYGFRRWAVVYPLLSLALLTAVFVLGGWKSILYLLLAQLFMTGFLHPVNFGAILNNSHFHGQGQVQPSSSYYGWFNWLTFNFGLHTEHHDLEKIPWFRLGKLRKIAPEYYDGLVQTRSYALLGLQFGFGARESFDAEEYRNLEMLRSAPADHQVNVHESD
jgi:sphingolipid delta-4 desaturase